MCDSSVRGAVVSDKFYTHIGATQGQIKDLTVCSLSADNAVINDLVVENLTVINGGGGGGGEDTPHVWRHFPDTTNGTQTVQLNPAADNYVIPSTLLFPSTTQNGSGTRLAFNATDGSLRAGQVTGAQWDVRGINSTAVGLDNSVLSAHSSILGGQGNSIGSTVSIGGNAIVAGYSNTILDCDYGSIGGGKTNNIDHSKYSVIGGGESNQIQWNGGTFPGNEFDYNGIFSGQGNQILYSEDGNNILNNVICGGLTNLMDLGSIQYNFIGGGSSNSIKRAVHVCIMGGSSNKSDESGGSVICGGVSNTATKSTFSFIGGGQNHELDESSGSVIVGGGTNIIYNARNCVIVGGISNTIDCSTKASQTNGDRNIIGAGKNNTIKNTLVDGYLNDNGIFAGINNTIESTVAGQTFPIERNAIICGYDNLILNCDDSAILSGHNNKIQSVLNGFVDSNAILGGHDNTIDESEYCMIGGGFNNTIQDNAVACSILNGAYHTITTSIFATGVFGSSALTSGVSIVPGGGFTIDQPATAYTQRMKHFGGTQQTVRSVNADTGMGLDDYCLNVTTGAGAVTVSLNPITPSTVGQEYFIRNLDGINTLTITTAGTIEPLIGPSGASVSVASKYCYHLVCVSTVPDVWVEF